MYKYLNILNKKEKISIIVIIFTILFSTILETIGIGIIIPAINIYIDSGFLERFKFLEYFFNLDDKNFIFNLLYFILIFFSFKTILLIFFKWIETNFKANLTTRISSDLFKYYINKDYEFFLTTNSSFLIRNIIQEVKMFVGNIIGSLLIIITELLLLIFLCGLAFFYEPYYTLYVIIIFFTFIIIYYFFVKTIIHNWGQKRQRYDGLRLKTLQESFGGNKEIKILGVEQKFISMFFKESYFTNIMLGKIQFVNAIPKISIEFIAIVLIISFLILGSNFSQSSELISKISIFAILGVKLMPSVNKILSSFQSFKFGQVSFDKLFDLNKKMNNSKIDKILKKNRIQHLESIHFNNVSYFYPNKNEKNPIIKNFSIKFNSGEFILINGISGSGKSTIVNLLSGILIPKKGNIIINNLYNLNSINNLNEIIGYCPQSIYLIDDTIKANIALGVNQERVNINRVKEIISLVSLDGLIEESEKGIETIVGEKGLKISGGQLQRIGIARALYNNPKLLILDEATNSIDANLELNILNKILKKYPKLITIFISHGKKSNFNFTKIIDLNKN